MSTLRHSTPTGFPKKRPPLKGHHLQHNNCSEIMQEIQQSSKSKQRVGSKSPASSPLSKRKDRTAEYSEYSDSDEDSNQDVSAAETLESIHNKNLYTEKTSWGGALLLLIAILGVSVGCICSLTSKEEPTAKNSIDLSTIKSEYPKQNEEFWLSIDTGIQDVITMNRPVVFIFLFERKTQSILNELLKKLSTYITCKLTECNNKPIVLTADYFNSMPVVNDFGIILDEQHEPLSQSGLMIIKNLEKIPGTTAQVFHSLCDEYNPFVARSSFIFTMEVEKMPENSGQFIINYLTEIWKKDLNTDKLYPLITRIVNMPLKVVS